MRAESQRIRVGRISGVYGVKGFVRVFSDTEPREGVAAFPRLWVGDGGSWQCLEVESGRAQGRGVILRFAGIEDREQALAMKGRELAIERDWLPDPEEGEFYRADLVGLDVVNLEGIALGQLVDFIETGANDVMVIRGQREHLVPWVQGRFVKTVDLVSRQIVVDWDADF
jgi:16S rRNA processing protein RimM